MTSTTLETQFSGALGRPIDHFKKLSGGCSYPSFVVYSGNQRFFVKTNDQPTNVFKNEAEGLIELEKWTTLAPNLIHWDQTMLVLEYVEPEAPTNIFWQKLGLELARLHQIQSDFFGLKNDNFIGLSKQQNICAQPTTWADFFWNHRLQFKFDQLKEKDQLFETEDRIQKLKQKSDQLLVNREIHPSPLHGDLWSGNILCGPNQRPYFFDPAFYYGDRETDLAMTECFGGFETPFYQAYQDAFPLSEDYQARKHLYNLYHMLNHQVIFGGQYRTTVRNIIDLIINS